MIRFTKVGISCIIEEKRLSKGCKSFVKWLFLLHILSIIYKIFQDFNFNQSVTVCLVTNAIIFILCIIADIGYLAYLIKNRNKNQEMHKKELSLTNKINNSMKKRKKFPKRKQ